MKKKKIIRFSVIGVIIVILIILAIGKKTGCIGKNETIEVATEKAVLRTITETVTASGRIQPEAEVKISPDVSGEIVEIRVKEGDKVKKGDLLARIKPDIYESYYERALASLNAQKAAEANAKARLAQVKAQFINAKATYERNETLWKQKVISQSEFDAAKSAYEVAKEEVTAAEESYKAAQYNVSSTEAGVKEARENLAKTNIYAPVDGIVSKLNIELGERVVGTSQFAGTEIMRISNFNEMEVVVNVNENDIVRVKFGDTALIEVDAYVNRKFKGIVTEIANSAEVSGISADQVTNFTVKVRILKESYKDLLKPDQPNFSPFRPGMSATVEIQTQTAYNVLSIPIQAVTIREDSSEKSENVKKENLVTESNKLKNSKNVQPQEIVFLYDNGKARKQNVKTGIQDNMYIQIINGLKENDEVIVAPYSAITKLLKDGSPVKKVDKKKLYTTEKNM